MCSHDNGGAVAGKLTLESQFVTEQSEHMQMLPLVRLF